MIVFCETPPSYKYLGLLCCNYADNGAPVISCKKREMHLLVQNVFFGDKYVLAIVSDSTLMEQIGLCAEPQQKPKTHCPKRSARFLNKCLLANACLETQSVIRARVPQHVFFGKLYFLLRTVRVSFLKVLHRHFESV